MPSEYEAVDFYTGLADKAKNEAMNKEKAAFKLYSIREIFFNHPVNY